MPGWSFGTTSDYARSGSPPVTGSPFTWFISAVTTSLAATQCPGEITASGQTAQNYRIQLNTDGTVSFSAANGSTTTANTANVVSTNVPFSVIGRAYDDTNRDTVLNGNLASKGSSAVSRIPTGINRLSYGKKDDASNANPFVGTIFRAVIWNVALGDAEVTALAAGIDPRLIRPAAIVHYADDFGTGSTGTIRDYRGTSALAVTGGSAGTASPPAQYGAAGPQMRTPTKLARTALGGGSLSIAPQLGQPASAPIGQPAALATGTGTTSATSDPFTPAANAKLIAATAVRRGSTSAPNQPTVTDSVGLTWTEISDQSYAPGTNPTLRLRIWQADVGASPVSMTVTCACSNAAFMAVGVLQIPGSGADFTNLGVGNDASGHPTATLPSSPAVTSDVLAFAAMQITAQVPPPDPAFAEIIDILSTSVALQVAYGCKSAASWNANGAAASLGVIVEAKPPVPPLSAKADAGRGALAITPAVGGRGSRLGRGGGSLSLTAGVGGRGTKAGKGNGALQPTLQLGGMGAASGILHTGGGNLAVAPQIGQPPWQPIDVPSALTTGIGTNSATTDPFQPSVGTKLIAAAAVRRGSVSAPNQPTITDSVGLVWTEISDQIWAPGTNPTLRLRAWQADSGASPVPMTVTCACSNAAFMAVGVLQIPGSGADFTNLGVGNDASGHPTATLPSSPAVTSDVLAFAAMQITAQVPPPDPAFAEIIDILSTSVALQVAYGCKSAASWNANGAAASLGVIVEAKPPVPPLSAKADAGRGALAITPAVGGRGSRLGRGGGSLATTIGAGGKGAKATTVGAALQVSCAIGGRGAKAARGAADLRAVIQIGGRGGKAARGTGTRLQVTSAVDGSGGKAGCGGGLLPISATLVGGGCKAGKGTGASALTCSLGGAGAKRATGSGALQAAASFGGRGGKADGGTGGLTLTCSTYGAGRKRGLGGADLVSAVAVGGKGGKAGGGRGLLAPPAATGGTGTKAGKGSAGLSLVCGLGGVGAKRAIGTGLCVIDIGRKLGVLGAEKGDFSEWSTVQSNSSPVPTIVTSPVGSGQYAFAFPDDNANAPQNRAYVTVPSTTAVRISFKMRATAWGRASDAMCVSGSNTNTWQFGTTSAANKIRFAVNGTNIITGNTALQADRWYQVVLRIESGGVAAVWLDGKLEGSATAATFAAFTQVLFIGFGGSGATSYLDDIVISADPDDWSIDGWPVLSPPVAVTYPEAGSKADMGGGGLTVATSQNGRGRKAGGGRGAIGINPLLGGVGKAARRGTGALTVAPALGLSGYKVLGGTSTFTVQPGLGGAGAKADRGAGILVSTCSIGGRGGKADQGAGTFASSCGISGRGSKAGCGAAALTAATAVGGKGGKAGNAAGSAVLPTVDLGGKASGGHRGTGGLALSLGTGGAGGKAGRGTGMMPVLVTAGGKGSKADQGSGSSSVTCAMGGKGAKPAPGTGIMPILVTAGGKGSKSARGGTALALTALFAGASAKAARGGASIAPLSSQTGAGAKAGRGAGILLVAANQNGAGDRPHSVGTGQITISVGLGGKGAAHAAGQGLLSVPPRPGVGNGGKAAQGFASLNVMVAVGGHGGAGAAYVQVLSISAKVLSAVDCVISVLDADDEDAMILTG